MRSSDGGDGSDAEADQAAALVSSIEEKRAALRFDEASLRWQSA